MNLGEIPNLGTDSGEYLYKLSQAREVWNAFEVLRKHGLVQKVRNQYATSYFNTNPPPSDVLYANLARSISEHMYVNSMFEQRTFRESDCTVHEISAMTINMQMLNLIIKDLPK